MRAEHHAFLLFGLELRYYITGLKLIAVVCLKIDILRNHCSSVAFEF